MHKHVVTVVVDGMGYKHRICYGCNRYLCSARHDYH